VPKGETRRVKVAVPDGERVPPLILRLVIRWRRLRSAALLVAGTAGSPTNLRRETPVRQGVPHEAILLLEDEADTTLEELRIVARAIGPDGSPVVREYLGLLDGWAGFPIASRRPA
jgi:hypothetical protein